MAKYNRYKVRNDFCILEIRQEKENITQFVLYGDGKAIRTYESPEEASAAVLSRNTGYWVIDQLKDNPMNHASIDEWEVIEE
jgi:hypothetical protein